MRNSEKVPYLILQVFYLLRLLLKDFNENVDFNEKCVLLLKDFNENVDFNQKCVLSLKYVFYVQVRLIGQTASQGTRNEISNMLLFPFLV